MAQYGFYFDQKACAGCHTCQIACKDKNRLDIGELLRKVRTYETGEFPNVGIYHMAESCAHCTYPACVEACPTKAVVECRGVNTSRCISCHTIEAEPQTELDLGGWIFGCDECQLCCPYNRNQADAEGEEYRPMFLPAEISAEEWLAMSEEEFTLRFGSTPLKRSGLRRIQQNVEKNKGV